jgi:hypothetical protein
MPWNQVMSKFKAGALKSGGSGKRVSNPEQAVAIMLSEKTAAAHGKDEYKGEAHTYDHTRPKRQVRSRYSK